LITEGSLELEVAVPDTADECGPIGAVDLKRDCVGGAGVADQIAVAVFGHLDAVVARATTGTTPLQGPGRLSHLHASFNQLLGTRYVTKSTAEREKDE
jgi:hypothetical protein